MKSIPSGLGWPTFLFLGLAFTSPFAAALAGTASPPTDDFEYTIKVRSEVDKPFGGFKAKAVPDHGKVYLIINLSEVKGADKLLRPVDEGRLLELTERELKRRGYRQMVQGETPNIVIVINYGRGYLRNVYTTDASLNSSPNNWLGNSGGYNDYGGGLPSLVITGAMPTQMAKEKESNYNALLESANMEKLYLRLTAFQYPKPKGKSPVVAWRTTMISDSPDYMDLNVIAPKMLEAGGSYFDKLIDKPEAILASNHLKESVEVGTPKVVNDSSSASPRK